MITLITGAPGAGKTAALVDMLGSVARGRAVYVDGIPDLALPDVDLVELKEPQKWPEEVPDGSVIVIDEVQRVWRPRGPGKAVPPEVAALETHRHRGLDFYLITQGPALLDKNVRALVGRHVHLRDIGFIGRWWYEWPECAENCSQGWKNAPLKKRYRLPKRVFGSYKSASLHVKPVRSFPFVLVIMVLALLVTAALSWRAYATITEKMGGAAADPAPAVSGKVLSAPPGAAPGGADLQSSPGQVVHIFDDRVAWTPRVSSFPESAPAYDHLRQVVNMPVVAGALCGKRGCKCFTQQGTDAGLSDRECKAWMDQPRFDAYSPPRPDPGPASMVPKDALGSGGAEPPGELRVSAEPVRPTRKDL